MGTYTWTFTQAGGCYSAVSGSLTVDCTSIDEMSGNVLLNIIDEGEEITTAPVFVLTSTHPLIGSWVDGHVNLNDGTNNYDYDVTEFDNIIDSVDFGTYTWSFTQAGGCYPEITGNLTVDCASINEMSGNVFLSIVDTSTLIVIDTSVVQEENVLTASATDVAYQWVDCNNDNTPIEGETNQIFTATTNGSYAVIVTDANCPESEMSSCYEISSVGVNTIEEAFDLNIYPNPASDIINIDLGAYYKEFSIQIYSLTGRLEAQANFKNLSAFTFHISDLNTGMYILKINANGKVNSSMFTKM